LYTLTTMISSKPMLTKEYATSSPRPKPHKAPSRMGFKSLNSQISKLKSTSLMEPRRLISQMAQSNAYLLMVRRKVYSPMAQYRELRRMGLRQLSLQTGRRIYSSPMEQELENFKMAELGRLILMELMRHSSKSE
jgi:hypothetical protein